MVDAYIHEYCKNNDHPFQHDDDSWELDAGGAPVQLPKIGIFYVASSYNENLITNGSCIYNSGLSLSNHKKYESVRVAFQLAVYQTTNVKIL